MLLGYYPHTCCGNNLTIWYWVLNKNKIAVFDDKYIRKILLWKHGYIFFSYLTDQIGCFCRTRIMYWAYSRVHYGNVLH